MRGRLTERLENWRRDFEFRKWLFILAVAFGALAGLVLVASTVTTVISPVCGRACHITNPDYRSWSASKHADIACHTCHVGRSPLNWLRQIVVEQPRRTIHMFGGRTGLINKNSSTASEITNDRCLGCHPEIRRETANTPGRRLRQRHREHTIAGVRCTDCHNRVAHHRPERYSPLKDAGGFSVYRDYAEMTGCWRCHSKDRGSRDDKRLDELELASYPPTACTTCHRKQPLPSSGRLAHAGGIGGAWENERHGRVAKTDFKACLPCHPRRSRTTGLLVDCTQCHQGVSMPHNAGRSKRFYESEDRLPDWAREHTNYKGDRAACGLCHESYAGNDPCAGCHHREFLRSRPDWTLSWPDAHQEVSRENSRDCQQCHMIEFCAYCHARGKKPPKGLYFSRLKR